MSPSTELGAAQRPGAAGPPEPVAVATPGRDRAHPAAEVAEDHHRR